MNEQVEVIVSGKVQGVFYRDFVKRAARRLRLLGEVFNSADGTVHVIAEGPREHLERLVKQLPIGSLASDVELVDVEWYPPSQKYKSFDITEE